MKKNYLIVLLLSFLIQGCIQNQIVLNNRKNFQVRFNSNDISELKNMKLLTLEKAQEIALKNNPDYRSMYFSVIAAKNQYYALMSGYLPKVELYGNLEHHLETSYKRKNPPADIYRKKNSLSADFTIETSYLIFDGLERELSILLAKNEYDQTLQANDDLKRILLRAVAYSYYDIILAAEEIRIGQADLDFQLSALTQAQQQYNSGFISQAAVLNFKIMANEARNRILDAVYRQETATFALLNLMGYSEFETPNLSFAKLTTENTPQLFSLETYLDIAVENRPDLKKAVLALSAAKLDKYMSYSAFSPEFYLISNLTYNFENGKVKHNSFEKSTYNDWRFSYGIKGRWNIFNGFADFFKIKEMAAIENAALQQVEKTYLDIINEVKVAYANFRKDYEKVKLYQESLVWVIEQRKLVEAEYWGGLATINRLNEAQSITVEAESRLAVALINMKKSFIQLQAAINSPELFPVTP